MELSSTQLGRWMSAEKAGETEDTGGPVTIADRDAAEDARHGAHLLCSQSAPFFSTGAGSKSRSRGISDSASGLAGPALVVRGRVSTMLSGIV
jgi:hypothetical protein